MKKILIAVVAALCLFLPLSAKAVAVEDYTTLNLKEILEAEEIEPSFDELKENDDQVIIYLFRGQGCGFCRGFLEYLNKIYEDEGDKFKVVSFQTWGDTAEAQANDALLREVAEFMGVAEPEKTGVPFIVIGDQYFPGFTEDAYGEAVLSAIDSEYNKDKEDRYDLFKAMNEQKKEKSPANLTVGGAVIITILAVGAVIVYDTIRFNKIQDELKQITKKKDK